MIIYDTPFCDEHPRAPVDTFRGQGFATICILFPAIAQLLLPLLIGVARELLIPTIVKNRAKRPTLADV